MTYFCCVEALQSADKHASGSRVRVCLSGSDGEVSFAVQDDGPGFAVGCAPARSGLQHMGDRLAALGCTLEINSQPGSGTTAGHIPIAAQVAVSSAGNAGPPQ